MLVTQGRRCSEVVVPVGVWVLMLWGRRVVLRLHRPVQNGHVVIHGYDHLLLHHRVQQAVQVEEEGDHLPAQVNADKHHVPLQLPSIVYLSWVILACKWGHS